MIVDILIKIIEEAVKTRCVSKAKDKKMLEYCSRRQYKSKNFIPKEVRSLFRNKARVTKSLKKVY